MTFERRWASAVTGTNPSRGVRLGGRQVLGAPATPPADGRPYLSAPRIRIFGEHANRSDFLVCAVFEIEGAEPQLAGLGSESLRSQAQAAIGGLVFGGIGLGRVPDACRRIEMLWMEIPHDPRVRGVLNAIETACSAVDYDADVRGSGRMALTILEHLELLLKLASRPRAVRAVLAADPSAVASTEYVALLPDLDDEVAEPRLWIRDGMLEVGSSPDGTSEYQTGSSLLFRVGPKETLGTARRHRLQRRLTVDMGRPPAPRESGDAGAAAVAARHARRDELAARFVFRPEPADFLPTLVRVTLGDALTPLASSGGSELSKAMRGLIDSMREESRYTVGLISPGVLFQGDPSLPPNEFRISIKERPVEVGRAYPDSRWCRQPVEALEAYGLKPVAGVDPRTGGEASWLQPDEAEKAEAVGFHCRDASSYLVDHIAVVFRRRAHELITLDDLTALLSGAPAVLAAVRAEPGELPRLFSVISALLQERVPLREWRAIVNRYLDLVKAGMAPGEIVEELRVLPAVRSSLPGNAGDMLMVRVPAPVLDAVSAATVRQGSTGALVFGPEALHQTLGDLRRALGGRPLPKPPVFVVDDPSMRPFVRLLLHYEFPDLHVLSRREVLAPEAIVDLESLEEDE